MLWTENSDWILKNSEDNHYRSKTIYGPVKAVFVLQGVQY